MYVQNCSVSECVREGGRERTYTPPMRLAGSCLFQALPSTQLHFDTCKQNNKVEQKYKITPRSFDINRDEGICPKVFQIFHQIFHTPKSDALIP